MVNVQQIKLSKMATFCYVIYDDITRNCGVIDPAFDTDLILNIIQSKGFTLTHVINTHRHADHTAGNSAMIIATGAKLAIHKDDALKLTSFINGIFTHILGGKKSHPPDILLQDNDSIQIGQTNLTVLHTPGHTEGSICLYTPGHLFSGDTLFVDGIGRTDLPGGSYDQIVAAIQKKLFTLPDDTILWPGHDYSATPSTTIGIRKLKII